VPQRPRDLWSGFVRGAFAARTRTAARYGRLALRLAWRASPPLASGIVLLMAAQALLRPLQLWLARAVVDRAALDVGLAVPGDSAVEALPLVAWMALAAASLALAQLLQPLVVACQDLAGDRLTGYVTEQLIRAANRWQGISRFEDPAFADDLERARSHAALGGLTVMLFGGRLVGTVVTVATLALVLAALHPLVPVGLVVAALPALALQWDYQHRTSSHLYAEAPEARRLQYSRGQLLAPEPAKDVRLYALGPFFRRQYDDAFARTMAPLDALRRRLVARVALADVLGATAAGAVYVYVARAAAQGHQTVGGLVFYGGAATALYAALVALATDSGAVAGQFAFLPSLFRVLEAPPDLPRAVPQTHEESTHRATDDAADIGDVAGVPARGLPAPRPLLAGIAFERVAFRYSGRDEPVLRDVSFTLPPGECLALVGHNGAGKTTIVKLLLRLYDPTEGRILLDGTDLREYDPEDVRREVGVIFQDFVRYELTAGENIGIGRLDALGDPARLLDAAARAGALEVVEHLPQGLDTRLGRLFGGRDLSGGEWQKLALARAFVRDSQLLVLDEPTAALDVPTEYEVYGRFHELTRGHATMLISHRFSTVRMADRILYLEGGTIREEGTHADLLAYGGEYARLYRLQAARYAEEAAAAAGGQAA
jgi:ATP-binding cassette subfamily B protein